METESHPVRCGRPWRLCALGTVFVIGSAFLAPARAGVELAQYVARPDDSYAFHSLRSGRLRGAEYLEAIVTSQTWRGIAWKHELFMVKPERLAAPAARALLFIDGGSWDPGDDSAAARAVPRETAIFVRLAEALRAPVAIVRQIPFEPLFEGRREDALIAYTFEQYLDTGDPDWPLLLPMVKAAVRAMDTVQQLGRERWGLAIERFTVTGASKRGWTSWLTAAVDPRVASVAPMVIDMLNFRAQIALQRQAFGALSEQIRDYERIHLPERIDSPTGRELVSMVDPYSYRDKLTQPKLVLLGTNDPYWPLEALGAYWSGLPEEKRVLYLPNQTHNLRDVDRLIGSIAALHRYSERGTPLPALSEAFAQREDRLELTVRSDRIPERILTWSASSPTRDFRQAHWSAHGCRRSGDVYLCESRASAYAYTAVYAEAVFQDRNEPSFSLSTTVHISGHGEADSGQ